MTFSNEKLRTTVSIVSVFETSVPAGDFAAFAILADAAGVSYGAAQFTHRSGALLAVINAYLENGGQVGREIFIERLATLRSRTPASVAKLARDPIFEKALKAAAITREMRLAQGSVLCDHYLRPAVEECGRLGLKQPLSLAVVYDSMVHGSWPRFRELVQAALPSAGGDEKQWITTYVRRRHTWLRNSPRLASTCYRTRFFLEQIMQGRWQLDLPLRVRGVLITRNALFPGDALQIALQDSAAGPANGPSVSASGAISAADPHDPQPSAPSTREHTRPPNEPGIVDQVENVVNNAAKSYDRVENVVNTVIKRRDAAKSLWTTVAAGLWQTIWAIAGFAYGIPRSIWLAAAVLTAVIALAYLYRQIALAKIRERH